MMDQGISDTFHTIGECGVSEFRAKGSKFLGYGCSVSNEDEIKRFLAEIVALHPKATHHCYAWRTGKSGKLFRANDDGEPSGTAGKPILGQIDSKGLTNTMVIIVRYYGGTKLGVAGLIEAYKECTKSLLEAAEPIAYVVQNFYELAFEYELMNQAMRHVKNVQAKVLRQEYDERCKLYVSIRQSEAVKLEQALDQAYKLDYKFLHSA